MKTKKIYTEESAHWSQLSFNNESWGIFFSSHSRYCKIHLTSLALRWNLSYWVSWMWFFKVTRFVSFQLLSTVLLCYVTTIDVSFNFIFMIILQILRSKKVSFALSSYEAFKSSDFIVKSTNSTLNSYIKSKIAVNNIFLRDFQSFRALLVIETTKVTIVSIQM